MALIWLEIETFASDEFSLPHSWIIYLTISCLISYEQSLKFCWWSFGEGILTANIDFFSTFSVLFFSFPFELLLTAITSSRFFFSLTYCSKVLINCLFYLSKLISLISKPYSSLNTAYISKMNVSSIWRGRPWLTSFFWKRERMISARKNGITSIILSITCWRSLTK